MQSSSLGESTLAGNRCLGGERDRDGDGERAPAFLKGNGTRLLWNLWAGLGGRSSGVVVLSSSSPSSGDDSASLLDGLSLAGDELARLPPMRAKTRVLNGVSFQRHAPTPGPIETSIL